MHLGDAESQRWLRELASGHDIMGVAPHVGTPKLERFLEDLVATAASSLSIAAWSPRAHTPATTAISPKVTQGRGANIFDRSALLISPAPAPLASSLGTISSG
jgi:hypothetical protein